ncbi:hypothetical protein [Paenibacillus sp. YYML68]|uniref:hypothetical protein n=1 Tax=Paenibacillus sp. YYML68 TaxID=2909250 RepID=UPI00249271DD|nr:hypothetical protein [Paenibacillus sp. YYML68]
MKHQLVKLVSEQANITEGQANEAVEAVIGYFRTRMPSEVAEEINNLALGHNQNEQLNR